MALLISILFPMLDLVGEEGFLGGGVANLNPPNKIANLGPPPRPITNTIPAVQGGGVPARCAIRDDDWVFGGDLWMGIVMPRLLRRACDFAGVGGSESDPTFLRVPQSRTRTEFGRLTCVQRN